MNTITLIGYVGKDADSRPLPPRAGEIGTAGGKEEKRIMKTKLYYLFLAVMWWLLG